MRSSRTITLFAPPPASPRGSSSFMFSILVHVVACGWLFFGLRHTPRIAAQTPAQRFTVRILNVPMTEPRIERPAASAAASAVVHSAPQSAAARLPTGGAPPPMPSVAVQLAQVVPRTQILVQPDAPPDILLQHPTPIPLVLRWTPPNIPTRTINPAPVQETIAANVRPSIEPPNRELRPADIKISSTNFPTKLPTLPPSTTSPIVVRRDDPVRRIPETSSKQIEETNSAQVLSVSDLQAQPGPLPIPLANPLYRPAGSDSLGTGQTVTSADAGRNPASNQVGTGSGRGSSSPNGNALTGSSTIAHAGPTSGPGQGSNATNGNAPAGTGSAAQIGPAIGTSQGSIAGPDSINEASVTRIRMPPDGKFGVVVVGSSLAEQYPETVGIWGGRLVYTVYLHVGPGKAWILQYSLPSAVQAAANGSNTRPEAPWPFDIVRPHLDPGDFTSDALMIHGFVNAAGRFDRLALVFPPGFAQAKFVLSALQQWEFRPARQNGQLAVVEVLLIIPAEPE